MFNKLHNATCLLQVVFLCAFFGLSKTYAGSNLNIDSLKIAYDYSESASERIDLRFQIAYAYYKKRSIDTAIYEYHKTYDLIPQDSIEKKAKVLTYLASAYRKIEDIENAKQAENLAINFFKKANATEKVARSLAVLGRDYYTNAQYDSAMVYYMEAKGIYESNHIVDENYGYLLHFIGSVFKRQGDMDKACDYYNQEIQYGKKHQFKTIEAEGRYLSGICIEDVRERLINDLECLEIFSDLGKERLVSLMYSNISLDYKYLDMVDSSLYWKLKCLQAYREQGEISHLSAVLSETAELYMLKQDYTKAEKYLKEAEEIALTTSVKKHLRLWDIYENYYRLNYNRGRYKEALNYIHLMYAYRDSSRDRDHQDAIQEMEMQYNDEKQKAQLAILQKDKDLAEKEKLLANEEAESQSFINKLVLIGSAVLLIAGIFVFIKYRESQKQKMIISKQKEEVEHQKDIIEEKNKDITDSMIYASSIQKAIITSESYLDTMFSDFFVFYRPRDIVSGDFYWAYQTSSGKKLIAVGDCTGHGVPGAMMSMLGTAFLNEIVIEKGVHEPAEILNQLRDQVKSALKTEERRDGMDISFCTIDNKTLTFCGANLPLYLLRKGELIEIKGNKQSVGFQPAGEKPFTQESTEMESGDHLYLFSDGYADQFGGAKGKKYKYKTFRNKLSQFSKMSFKEQRSLLDTEFENWKGDLEQLDDVCVLGLTV